MVRFNSNDYETNYYDPLLDYFYYVIENINKGKGSNNTSYDKVGNIVEQAIYKFVSHPKKALARYRKYARNPEKMKLLVDMEKTVKKFSKDLNPSIPLDLSEKKLKRIYYGAIVDIFGIIIIHERVLGRNSPSFSKVELTEEEYLVAEYPIFLHYFKIVRKNEDIASGFVDHLKKEFFSEKAPNIHSSEVSNKWEKFRILWKDYKEDKVDINEFFEEVFNLIGEKIFINSFSIYALVCEDFIDIDKKEYNINLKQSSDLIYGKNLIRQIKLPNDGCLEAISPDGKLFLIGEARISHIIDIEREELIKSFPGFFYSNCSFSRDNNYIVFAGFSRMFLWHIKEEKMIWKIDSSQYRKEKNLKVEITPDNKFVVSVGISGIITVRDLKDAQKTWSKKKTRTIGLEFVISNDSKYIFRNGPEKITIYDLESGDLVKSLYCKEDGEILINDVFFDGLAISHNNSYIAGSFSCWDTETCVIWDLLGNIVHVFNEGDIDEDKFVGLNLEFSPDGTYLATTDINNNKLVNIREVSTGKLVCKLNHEFKIKSIKFIPQTGSLLSSTYNGYIFYWDYLPEE